MELKGDDIALYLSGQPVPIKSCNIIAVQPTIKQIVAFKESDFLLAANFLGKPQSHIEKIRESNPEKLSEYTDYQIYMALIRQDESLNKCVTNFFDLVFPDYIVEIENDIGFIKDNRRVGMVNPFNFEDFRDTIKYLFLSTKAGQDDYNPANDKAAALAKKFAKAREKIQGMKKTKQDEKATLFGSYASILSIGTNIDINILYNYTPFQIYNLFNRYWKKVNSDFYQKVSTTPMMDVSKMEQPEEWSANIY